MRETRHSLKFSQAKLAEKVGTAPTYIAMIELGKRFPSVEMLERIASALNIDSPDLFSKNSFHIQSLGALKESVLRDIDTVIRDRINELHEVEKKYLR
jgi:transcriptional regulator with XRE-family HTH domain